MIHTTPPPEGTPQIDGKQIKWGFIQNYYDGPLSGMVKIFSGEFIVGEPVYILYWAECFEESNWDGEEPEPEWYRKYKVWKLNSESFREQIRRQRLFEEYVGTHWTYDDAGQRGTKTSRNDWHKYYDMQKSWPEWKAEGEIIGWFQN